MSMKTLPSTYSSWWMRSILAASLILPTLNSTAQIKWFKYEGNPVLRAGATGSWDSKWAGVSRIIADSAYRMWYTGSDGKLKQMGYAVSSDGIHWRKHDANPILQVNSTGWDSLEACFGYVIRVPQSYDMWYSGGDAKTYRHIGFAQSPDGIHWTRLHRPITGSGGSPMESVPMTAPSIVGPDSTGSFRMWFNTMFDADARSSEIGSGHGANAVSWSIRETPVLTPDDFVSWHGGELRIPRILSHVDTYEMWVSGSVSNIGAWFVEYLTSPDGIAWKQTGTGPVLLPGPPGSWDGFGVWPGDIVRSADMYSMWYVGAGGVSTVQTGFAVSPVGISLNVTTPEKLFRTQAATSLIEVKVPNPKGLSFSADILTPARETDEKQNLLSDLQPVASLELFDDGSHGDRSAGDGVYANAWTASEEKIYVVDLRMELHRHENLAFVMKGADAFATLGPVKVDSVIVVGSSSPTPGSKVSVKLVLRNEGSAASVIAVTASLALTDSRISQTGTIPAVFGHIVPGGRALSPGTLDFEVDPDYPVNSDVDLAVVISSRGIPLWRDTFRMHVYPPWWRTEWAFVTYGAFIVIGLLIVRGVESRRTRKRHLREIERLQTEKLKELDQLKSRFFANISHELRTPLALIAGPLRELQSGVYKGRPDEQYEMMLRNTERLTCLVEQLLDLSKIDAGQLKIRVRMLDVAELSRSIAAAFESLAKRMSIEFVVETPQKPLNGWFDADALEKILTNLLSNAFKFTPERGRVLLRVELGGPGPNDQVNLIITDTGGGIAPDQLPKIFDRFYQVEASESRDHAGSGIGLALTKELVELHNGQITVASEPGHGTTFTVRIPLENGKLASNKSVEGEERKRIPEIPHVDNEVPVTAWTDEEVTGTKQDLPLLLIIEDNADMRRFIRRRLEAHHRIIEAVDGEEGHRKAIETIPDLVISDVMMPKMDGIAVCRELKADERTNHIPVILLTAKAEREDKIEGLQTGADDYLVKPFDSAELLARVNSLVVQRRKLRERFKREVTLQPHDIPITPIEEQFLERAKGIVENRLSDTRFGVDAFAEAMALSRSQLHRKMSALTGVSPGDFIRSLRLQRAAVLLRKRFGTVSEVAYEVGYSNPSHFSESFRNQFGVPPSEYAKS